MRKLNIVPRSAVRGAFQTRVIKSQGGRLSQQDLKECLDALRKSGVIVIPTDTVYGIACNAFDPVAIRKVYAVKGRHYTKPLPILLHSSDQLSLVADGLQKEASFLTQAFWPGPLTLIFRTGSLALHASRGRSTIAVRVPDCPIVREILRALRVPLAATSANVSGRSACCHGDEAIQVFDGKVDVIVDAGRCPVGQESSVVDATHYPFTVLRHGALSKEKLERTLKLST